jgi:hypothetical protein
VLGNLLPLGAIKINNKEGGDRKGEWWYEGELESRIGVNKP